MHPIESTQHFSGVVFDFNGTLLWDSELHKKAWNIFLDRHNISEDKKGSVQGKSNEQILRDCIEPTLPHDQIQRLATEKELIYQELYLNAPLTLAPGAITFFEDLQKFNIPFALATSSPKINVDFYFKHLKLAQWFERSSVFYDDGIIPPKPDPRIFHLAIDHIHQPVDSVLVCEDSVPGITAAHRATVGKVIVVKSSEHGKNPYLDSSITHFDQVDRGLFTFTS